MAWSVFPSSKAIDPRVDNANASSRRGPEPLQPSSVPPPLAPGLARDHPLGRRRPPGGGACVRRPARLRGSGRGPDSPRRGPSRGRTARGCRRRRRGRAARRHEGHDPGCRASARSASNHWSPSNGASETQKRASATASRSSELVLAIVDGPLERAAEVRPAPAGRFPEHPDRRRRRPASPTARRPGNALHASVRPRRPRRLRSIVPPRTRGSSPASRSVHSPSGARGSCRSATAGRRDRLRRPATQHRGRSCPRTPRASGRRAARPRSGARSSIRSSREAFAAVRGHPARRRSGAEARARGARARSSADSTDTRAAASSSASGSPSRRRQISPTAGLAENPGSTARARSRKSVIASSSGSGSTGNRCSPARLSGSRLVASSFTPLVSRSSSARSGAASRTCSRLSSSSSALRPRRNSATPSLAPTFCAIVGSTSRGSATAWRGTQKTPPSKSSTASAASWSARRVFPEPPGPTSVTSRFPRRSAPASASSLSLPTSGVGCTGQIRLVKRLEVRELSRA